MTVVDDLNRTVTFYFPPVKIVSIVPSLTELLFDLGLYEEIVGITKYCIYPVDKTKNVKKIGGTKNFKIDEIIKLNPDIVFANKEENTKELIEKLSENIPVYVTDIKDIDDAINSIKNIGFITGKKNEAELLSQKIEDKLITLQQFIANKPTCVYLIWKQPLMSVGKDTFINSMLEICGFNNLIAKDLDRYPELSIEQLQNLKPEYLLLSTEPYLFKQSHIEYFEKLLPNTKVKIVDGSYFSWYGSRISKSLDYFIELRKGF